MWISIPGLEEVPIPSISHLITVHGREIHYFPGERFLFGMGCKLFRFLPYVEFYNSIEHRKGSFLLHGNLHSNYLSSFCYFLHLWKIPFRTIAYSWDRDKRSANSTIVRKYSTSLSIFNPRDYKSHMASISGIGRYDERVMSGIVGTQEDEKTFILPNYGMSDLAIKGASKFWEFLPYSDYKNIVVDLGSGLSFLSIGLNLRNSDSTLWGISSGESPESWLKSNAEYIQRLGLGKMIGGQLILMNPEIDERFSKLSYELKNYVIQSFQKGIPLEPIYSAKTLYTLEKKCEGISGQDPILYIHQGGLLNWISIFNDDQSYRSART